ncbi:hypothetical protein O3M35_007284 [Rhynocoris fuscipes]|uniref:Lipase domain-containing protein n=1 Tax=Rhynocoris fuscipes TaxID=488301 RepID=A0AAW1DCI7_9HEMI
MITSFRSVELPLNFTSCIVAEEKCPNEHIKFYLYNRKISETSGLYEISEDEFSLKLAPLKTNSDLVVLLHGYTGNKDYSPNMELRPAFLTKYDINIISVDWSPLARSPCYVQAATNTDIVGLCTAKLLNSLFTMRPESVSCERTHVIGFSLGAHCAGDTGKYLIEMGCTLPWITGLDPALPLFSEITSNQEWTIEKNDAEFVDIIHTNAGWKGQLAAHGHADFYINSGYIQPGCIYNSSCDHVRAVEIYRESILDESSYEGMPCILYITSFVLGIVDQICKQINLVGEPSETVPVGINVPHDARGTYQVLTNNIFQNP